MLNRRKLRQNCYRLDCPFYLIWSDLNCHLGRAARPHN
uniref:Uncharacterized protein n=1 Tax=Ciona intestinalis TaxID=7719 RepID=H2Y0G3_CIOIN